MPNPTDTARALVTSLEQLSALKLGDEIMYGVNSPEAFQRKAQIDDARAALLAHVDTLRIERDGFKELYEEWLTWAKGAVEKCKPEIPPSDSPQAQGIIDERLAHVAGVEQLATFGARVMLEHHNDGERGDVDGGWLQAAAIDTGVAKEESRVVPCSNNCPCAEWGDDGDSVPCVVIQNMPLLQALATRPTEARDE